MCYISLVLRTSNQKKKNKGKTANRLLSATFYFCDPSNRYLLMAFYFCKRIIYLLYFYCKMHVKDIPVMNIKYMYSLLHCQGVFSTLNFLGNKFACDYQMFDNLLTVNAYIKSINDWSCIFTLCCHICTY